MTGSARLGLVLAFAGLGGTAGAIPALLPDLGTRLGSNMAMVVPLLFAGLCVGVLLSAPMLGRLRVSTVLIAGAALQAGSVLWLAQATTVDSVLVVAVCAGVGFGLAEAAGSVAAKRWTDGSVTRTLAMLTATVAAVAALGPIAVAFLPAGTWLVPVLVATIHLLAGGVLFRAAGRVSATERDLGDEVTAEPGSERWTPSAKRVAIVAGMALALYVGVEAMFSGWSALIPAAILDIPAPSAALGTSAFWLCMAGGRAVAALLLRRGVRADAMLVLCFLVATLAFAFATFLAPSPVVLLAAGLAVLAMAPVYSLVLGEALDRLSPRVASRATGALVACGAFGGAIIPLAIALAAAGQHPGGIVMFFAASAICATLGVGAVMVYRDQFLGKHVDTDTVVGAESGGQGDDVF